MFDFFAAKLKKSARGTAPDALTQKVALSLFPPFSFYTKQMPNYEHQVLLCVVHSKGGGLLSPTSLAENYFETTKKPNYTHKAALFGWRASLCLSWVIVFSLQCSLVAFY